MANLVIQNWERFQHYKDRNAPWMKLYRDMLTGEAWVLGTDLSRVVQVASIMLAPRYSNSIPYRFDLLKKVMSLDCTETAFTKAVQHLIESNFLEIQQCTNEAKVVAQSASTLIATCTSEERRGEERESREEKNPLPPKRGLAVFEHWQREWNHPDAKFDQKRQKRIEARLQNFTVEQLCNAISGFRHSTWHMGTDPKGNGTVYDGIETLLRDTEQVEKGLQYFSHPPRPPPKPEQLSPVERVLRANGVNRDERVVSEQQVGSVMGDVDRDLRESSYSGFRRLGA